MHCWLGYNFHQRHTRAVEINQTAVNLPGSLDWYDDVTLEVLDGAP